MRYRLMAAALARIGRACLAGAGVGDRSRSHPLVDVRRRGGSGRRTGQGVRRHGQQLGRRRHCRLRRHGAPGHDQPHHRRRPDGRHPVQPPAARPRNWSQAGLMRDLTDVATKEKWAEIIRPKSLLDGCTIDGKVYCVAGQHPFLAVALALQRGLRRRPACRCRRTGTSSSPRHPRSKRPASSRWPSAGSPGRRPAPSTC